MLLEVAVADAYGEGFKYADAMVDHHNDLSAHVQPPRHSGIQPGTYTDDTQMTLAVADFIASGQAWTPAAIAEQFVRADDRDPRDGYSRRTGDALRRARSGQEFIDLIDDTSDKMTPPCPSGFTPLQSMS